jgi:hypothetical protein
MADCDCLGGCPFFNDKMPMGTGLGKMFKRNYCQGDNTQCARFIVKQKLGKPGVPPNLYPNQVDRAKAILTGA